MEKSYIFDLAISYVDEDKQLANSIYTYFKDRIKVFNYKYYQKLLGGTDGTLTLNKVFGQDSRLVIILYRPSWGTTPFTRDEMEAIRDRSRIHGYDFCLMAPIIDCDIPAWFPKYRIWLSYPNLKLNGLKSIIEERIKDAGANLREETLEELYIRKLDEFNFNIAKERFLSSEKAVDISEEEFHKLVKIFADEIKNIKSNSQANEFLNSGFDGRSFFVEYFYYRLKIIWSSRYTNTLDEAKLIIEIWERGNTHPVKAETYKFDMPYENEYQWKSKVGDNFYSISKLANFWLKELFNKPIFRK